ncbi:enoyl-CoA hydratase/isomerase family protein [Wenyingzhuangia sp. IMCC45533]
MEAFVKTTIQNHIGEIEFFNPASNSLNSLQLKELSKAILICGEHHEVRVIHLKSSGARAFCAGASFDELLAIDDLETGTSFFMGFANVINAIRTCDKIVVTSVQGKTVGGGVGIAAASDYVFATESASIKLSELSIGIGPFVIQPAVSRKVGLSNFTALTLNPKEWKTAVWANNSGLFHKIYPSIDNLTHGVNQYLEDLVSYNLEALNELKKALWADTEHWSDLLQEKATISGKLVLSKETKKALSQFKNK